jgi:hypothetical protein
MVCAKDFLAGFIAEFDAARQRHTDEAWAAAWSDSAAWTRLMLPVIRSVAPRLALTCAPGEPLSYDAVFVRGGAEQWERFPILVAIEHENYWGRFEHEIGKLFTIRCPLKVGMTYLTLSQGQFDKVAGKIERHIEKWFGAIKPAEDPDAEYLFIIGREIEPLKIEWHALAFRAGDGPHPFQPVSPDAQPVAALGAAS